jgi:long-chain fatty acid transport protein
MRKGLILSGAILLMSGIAGAGGYKIPEQSIRSMGTAGAYMSSSRSADANYYNPANMSWMEKSALMELGFKYINLPSVKFRGQAVDPVLRSFVLSDASSKSENFLIPYFHYVSPPVGDFRFGLSLTTPAGLSKRWSAKIPKATAEEFTLRVVELSLGMSYRLTEKIALGGGLRGVYADGKVKYQYEGVYKVDMEGDNTMAAGYYVSLSFRPSSALNISALYRSKVDLDIKGDAKGYVFLPSPYNTLHNINPSGGSVSVPLPAEFRLGVSYSFGRTVLELTYEKTFWSDYNELDFNFADILVELSPLGEPKEKDWKDSDTIRLGITHAFSDKFTALAGVAYDNSPIPEKSLGFELPDSSAWILSLGGIYRLNPNWEVGLAYLFVTKDSRKVSNKTIKGEFSELKAHLVNLSVGYRF